MIGVGSELAEMRNRVARKEERKFKKEQAGRAVATASENEVLVPNMNLDDVRLDIMSLFQ